MTLAEEAMHYECIDMEMVHYVEHGYQRRGDMDANCAWFHFIDGSVLEEVNGYMTQTWTVDNPDKEPSSEEDSE